MAKKTEEFKNPRSCLNKAAPDEPLFVLRAKDALAAELVRLWAKMAHGVHEPEKIQEALALADSMDQWRAALPKPPDASTNMVHKPQEPDPPPDPVPPPPGG